MPEHTSWASASVVALGLLALAGPADGQIPDKTLGGILEFPPGPAPTGVTVRAVHPTEVLVTWQPASGATGYNVLRSSSASGPFYAVNDPALSATVSSFADRGLTPKSTVSYQVQALYSLVKNSPGTSGGVSVTLPPALQPASLQAVAGGPDAVDLSWPAPAGATGFAVMRSAGGSWKTLNNGQLVRGSSYKDSGLGPGTYTYRVIAYYQIAGKGEIEGELTGIPEASVSVGPRSGRYRVTIAGFTVDRPTLDHALQVDGKGDEIWIEVSGFEVDRNGTKGPLWSRETNVYGDTKGYPTRIRAGTAGRTGGLVSGDAVPVQPWVLTGPAQANRLPLFVWEGLLVEGERAVLFAPRLWEWDGAGNLYAGWKQARKDIYDAIYTKEVEHILSIPVVGDVLTIPALIPAIVVETVAGLLTLPKDVLGSPADRPIGLLERGGQLAMDGQFVKLDFAAADGIAGGNVTGVGPGIARLDFVDKRYDPIRMRPYEESRYTLWLLVERLP